MILMILVARDDIFDARPALDMIVRNLLLNKARLPRNNIQTKAVNGPWDIHEG